MTSITECEARTEPGQDSERASLSWNAQQVHVLAEVWSKPLASAMGFLTPIDSTNNHEPITIIPFPATAINARRT